MKMDYQEAKKHFLGVKKEIDEMIERKGVVRELRNKELKLDSAFEECIDSCKNDEDKKFISFNYYPCKAMIFLSKGWKYKALIECLKGLEYFLKYLKSIRDKSRWLKSLEYYKSRFSIILNKKIELFGNMPDKQFNEIMSQFKEVINNTSIEEENLNNRVITIILDLLIDIILDSSEIYTKEHLKRKEKILVLTESIGCANQYIEGLKNQIKFILLKKHLHFLLRKYIPPQKKVDSQKIENIINQLKQTAGAEKNKFNKMQDEFKKILAKIDTLTADYYDKLWVKNDLIKGVKVLENIFEEIRRNISLIKTPKFFEYFINEYMFLTNFVKILILAQDFNNFSAKTKLEWQKELAIKIKEQLDSISMEFFKYPVTRPINRKLLILQGGISGKFAEFIVFYLLREIAFKVATNGPLKSKISSSKREINEILKQIKKIKDPISEIQWSKKIGTTDIDILINSTAIFIKTGLISSSDKAKIRNELKIAKDNNYRPYVIVDISKNVSLIREVDELVDIGEFLQEIFQLSKKIGIPIELPLSGIKSFAGFTGG